MTSVLEVAPFIGYRRWTMNMTPFPHPGGPDAADPAQAGSESPVEDRAALAERLRALAHPVRLRVLETLAGQDRCVCGEIVRGLPLAQSTVSQHLKVLTDSGLIRSRTEGQRTAYCLDRDAISALKGEIDALFSGLLPPGDCCAPPVGRTEDR
ncbi:ArsR/SmtB family transcription factor [Xanthobacter oligotrophicus]|uniref:ArsR/SmtB family transcription factor n=1 Tax=Xanthobacter oligotrophicus TaxID=2607286 RepID=UPI001E4E2A49|nr:metalloregulator ArsR/SmtB family transcription factor [Xanthobacter oligotrophicus]MCG5233926.1 metalloregulator ArsR/SmtB family transcription factor [Xanthobacter oligotrophicus]